MMEWGIAISAICTAALLGIGVKLAQLLSQANAVGGYVILPFFPNIFDALVIVMASSALFFVCLSQAMRKKDKEDRHG